MTFEELDALYQRDMEIGVPYPETEGGGMSNVETFTNEAIPGIKTQVSVMKGSKSALFIRDDMEGEEPSVIMLDYQTALKVANWILENTEEVGE